jgi:hypothetical protein
MCRLKNDDNNNISMTTAANSVEQIYDVMLGTGFVVLSILALVQLLMATINKFVEYYSRQIDRIVMDESFDESDDDDDSSESDYSEYSENESSESECSDDDDDGKGNCSKRNHHDHDDIELSPYIPPRRSERLAENRAKCNSPLLVCRLKFD